MDIDRLVGQRVDVYRNLRYNTFSIRHKGKVVAHCKDVYLEDVVFVVSEAGRQRVLKTGQKNVHAVVRGTFVRPFSPAGIWRGVTYDPYKYDSFVLACTKTPIRKTQRVHLSNGKWIMALQPYTTKRRGL